MLDGCTMSYSLARSRVATFVIVPAATNLGGLPRCTAVECCELACVELEHGVAFGEIRHCHKADGAYRAGIFVEEFICRTPGEIDVWERTAQRSAGEQPSPSAKPSERHFCLQRNPDTAISKSRPAPVCVAEFGGGRVSCPRLAKSKHVL